VFCNHLFDRWTCGRVLERILRQFQDADPAEHERPELKNHFAAQPDHIAVLQQHVHSAVVRMKRIRLQVQLTDPADVHREVCAGVFGQHALWPYRYQVEPGHVERPKTGERRKHLVVDGQVTSAVAVKLQNHQSLVQVLDRFPDHVLENPTEQSKRLLKIIRQLQKNFINTTVLFKQVSEYFHIIWTQVGIRSIIECLSNDSHLVDC